MKQKIFSLERKTRETAVRVVLGGEKPLQRIVTPLPLFSHFVEQLTYYAGLPAEVEAQDLVPADEHHVVEDTAIVLGTVWGQVLGDRTGIQRFGQRWLPMDDALALAALDVGGRFWYALAADFPRPELGGLACENIRHFFRSFADAARITLHQQVRGENTHHMAEALFKATGLALAEAMTPWTRGEARSTKGVLA